MPRVIFVTDLTVWSLKQGHGGPAFSKTLKKYMDEGCEVFLISDVPSNAGYPELDTAHNIVVKPSLWKRFLGVRKIGLLFKYLDYFVSTRRLKKQAKRLLKNSCEDTVLYAYEIFGVKLCKKLSRRYGVPLVTRFQGTILAPYRNTAFNRFRHFPHFHALAEHADLVIMTDDGTQGDQVLHSLENRENVMFLRNGLDLMENVTQVRADFDRGEFRRGLGISDDRCMFLTVSRLVPWKKVERAIAGFADFCRKGGSGKLVIVGDGDSMGFLQNEAKAQGVEDDVVFVGSVAHDKVYEYMMACDVFLSLYDLSNVGNPLLEAMTLQTVIITLDVGDTCKLIKNGENGVLLSANGLPMLGAAMLELAGDAEKRALLSANAACYASAHFRSWRERMNVEYDAVCGLLKNTSK